MWLVTDARAQHKRNFQLLTSSTWCESSAESSGTTEAVLVSVSLREGGPAAATAAAAAAMQLTQRSWRTAAVCRADVDKLGVSSSGVDDLLLWSSNELSYNLWGWKYLTSMFITIDHKCRCIHLVIRDDSSDFRQGADAAASPLILWRIQTDHLFYLHLQNALLAAGELYTYNVKIKIVFMLFLVFDLERQQNRYVTSILWRHLGFFALKNLLDDVIIRCKSANFCEIKII